MSQKPQLLSNRISPWLILFSGIVLIAWVLGMLVHIRASQVAVGPTPISAVQELIAQQTQDHPAVIGSFHALLTHSWENEVIVLYEIQDDHQLTHFPPYVNGSKPLICFNVARPTSSWWEGKRWESGYEIPIWGCYDPDDNRSEFVSKKPELFTGSAGNYSGKHDYVWVFYGKTTDPKVTQIEIATGDGEIVYAPVRDGAFLAVVPRNTVACQFRALNANGTLLEQAYRSIACQEAMERQ